MPIRNDYTYPDGPVSPEVEQDVWHISVGLPGSTNMIIPATQKVLVGGNSRIRDLWDGKLAGTGKCPSCDEPLGEPHAQPCRYKGIVGSNPEEHYL